MDDLSQKLSELLQDPGTMEKIQSMMNALGGSHGSAAASPPAAPPQAETAPGTEGLQALLASLSGATSPPESGKADSSPDLAALARLAPLLSGLRQEDENTALLRALRPYLHGDREKRLDDAIQMMRLLRFLPLLQDKGTADG